MWCSYPGKLRKTVESDELCQLVASRNRMISLRSAFRLPVQLYHRNLGWLLGRRFLMVTHTGRRTGKRHDTVLETMAHRGSEMIVMSAFGRNAHWLRNIQVNPDIHITTGSRPFAATFRILTQAEAIAVMAEYEHRNRLAMPIIRAVLTRLLGWPYNGSAQAQSRLAVQLPFVAFRPAIVPPATRHPQTNQPR
jgi:deazaflavin-dependent oxidoreductase (nitroreductase family)